MVVVFVHIFVLFVVDPDKNENNNLIIDNLQINMLNKFTGVVVFLTLTSLSGMTCKLLLCCSVNTNNKNHYLIRIINIYQGLKYKTSINQI